jgi:hypothetical protein
MDSLVEKTGFEPLVPRVVAPLARFNDAQIGRAEDYR